MIRWRCTHVSREGSDYACAVYRFDTVDHQPPQTVFVHSYRDRMLWRRLDRQTQWRAPREMMRAVYAVAAFKDLRGSIDNVPAYELGVHINW